MNHLTFLMLLLSACISIASAASAPTFCKCTCFTNSTIIEIKSTTPGAGSLGGSHDDVLADPLSSSSSTSTSLPTASASPEPRKRAAVASPSCSQCNRAFCLTQSLPICKGAAEKNVVTMCFQRDSRKDQVIVWGFILGTAGLLGWAAVRRVMEMREIRGGGGLVGAFMGGASEGELSPVGRVSGGGGGRIGVGVGAASGSNGGRGQYASVAGHSRESSML